MADGCSQHRARWLRLVVVVGGAVLASRAVPHPRLLWLQLGSAPRPSQCGSGAHSARAPLSGGPCDDDRGLLVNREAQQAGAYTDGSGIGEGAGVSSALGLVKGIFAALCAAATVFVCTFAWPAIAADSTMASVAPCLFSSCRYPLAQCVLDPNCAANLTCILSCTGRPDENACQIRCGDLFEDNVVDSFNDCALSRKNCVPQRPDVGPAPGDAKWTPTKGRYPPPPPESVSTDFQAGKMSGRWFISAGLNPIFDTFDCQAHFFQGYEPVGQPGKVVGKINWRVNEPDGEFITRSTVQTFLQRGAPGSGLLENHGNEYLHYQDDWYILDHGFEDDPDLGFILIYYSGSNDAWKGYGGGCLYTRSRTVPPEILDRVRQATAKAKVPYDTFWKATDNTCAEVVDPVKLRTAYAEKVLEQAELSAEEQLTYLARMAFREAEADERQLVQQASRIEKMTEAFVKKEVQVVEQEVEKPLWKAFAKLGLNFDQQGSMLS